MGMIIHLYPQLHVYQKGMPETPTFSEIPFRTCQVCRIVFDTIEEKEEHTKSEHP
jgi:hypothetical protein